VAEVLVVGAGISGLAAAADLRAAGHDVVVVDKGRRPGGRMATRRDGDATWDHGAQFLTAKDDGFATEVARWQDAGVAATWFQGAPDEDAEGADGHPRFRGAPYMRAVPEHLAGALSVRCGVRLEALRHADGRWVALAQDGAHLSADALVLTPPAPQTLALLEGTSVGGAVTDGLRQVAYDPCWAVLVRPDGTPDLPGHGALRLADHPLHMVVDNHRKGISAAPAVTLHASAARTRELFDRPGDVVGARLLADAAPWLAGTVVRTHRWRFSRPTGPGPADALATTDPGPVAVAGDGLAGGRVEGAWSSGRAAARLLREAL
jgi:renalase